MGLIFFSKNSICSGPKSAPNDTGGNKRKRPATNTSAKHGRPDQVPHLITGILELPEGSI
jgi:hypothetical protein